MEISVIVPIYNEEESIMPMHEAISRAIRPLGLPYEIIFVDDGSSDNTFQLAKDLAKNDSCLRVIKLRKNYGQTPAMAAGIDNASGNVLITMDGDLQNDPSDIPLLIQKINEGYDLAVGWRHNRQDKLMTRKIPSIIANWIIGKVTGVPIKDNGCSLKAYRSSVIKNIPLYSDMHRFIPAMVSITGAKIAEIKVKHHARQYGKSKYGLSRIYMVLLDLLAIKTIISFSSRPLFWFSIISIPVALVSFIALFISIYEVMINNSAFSVPIAGIGVIFTALTCFLILCGVLGELIYRTGDTNMHDFSSVTARELGSENNNIES